MAETKEIQKPGPVANIRNFLANVDVQSRLENILGKRSAAFGNSIVNVVSGSRQLMDVARNNPGSIMRAAFKAATINLPIDPALGQAAIVPYGNEAVFQIMYRGVIQLCIRSGQYKTINCSEIYADEIKSHNPITGEMVFNDPETFKMRYSDDRDKHVVGHYLYFKLLTGFEKSGYITTKEALAHAKKYSKAYQYDLSKGKKTSAWSTDPIPMGNKTIIIHVLTRYGIMSIEMQDALVTERESFDEAQANAARLIDAESGSEPIDTNFESESSPDEKTEDQAKTEAEDKKLKAAEKRAKAKAKKAAAAQAKAQAKDKDAKPKWHCNKGNHDFDEPNATDVVKGAQCSECYSWQTVLNVPADGDPEWSKDNPPDPSITKEP